MNRWTLGRLSLLVPAALPLLLAAFSGSFPVLAQSGLCVEPPPGLVAWWPLDEGTGATSVADIAGGNHGIPLAGPIDGGGPATTAGIVNGALYFTSPNTYIRVPDSPALNFGTGDFTVDAWVKPVPVGPTWVQPIVEKVGMTYCLNSTSPSPVGYRLYIHNGNVVFLAHFGCASYILWAPVAYNTWQFVVAQRAGNTLNLYVNGVLASSSSWSAPLGDISNNADLLLGKNTLVGLPPGNYDLIGEITLDEVELFDRALSPQEIQALYASGPAGKCKPGPKVTADLGDAPDSTNHAGKKMTAYSGVPAQFPTVSDQATGFPPGPKHLQPRGLAWLGKDVSFENEADLLPDADGLSNIDPATDAADRDQFDDGVTAPIAIPLCGQTQFQYVVTSTAAAKLYLNVWFDFNRDGDWSDPLTKCPLGPATTGSFTEWAIQNEQIAVPGPGTYTFTTPPFRAANPTRGSDMWMRITLTDQPIGLAQGADGSGPVGGYVYGETEDYLLHLAYAEICGIKFHDLNGNGVQDPGEPGLAGWVIHAADFQGNAMGYAITDEEGRFCLIVPVPGMYTVSEDMQSGWTSTTPVSQTVTVPGKQAILAFGNKRVESAPCDLALKKEVQPSSVASGQQVTFTLTVTNVGSAPCPGPTSVTETVPAGLNLVSASGSGWLCLGATCIYPLPIPPGGSASLTLVFQVTAPAGTVLENCASLTNASDANIQNNRACAKIEVGGRSVGPALPTGSPDLAVQKLLDGELRAGQEAVYVIRVSNVGTIAALGPIQVMDTLPPGLSFVSASGAGWTCLASGPSVTCTHPGPLPPGGTLTLTLRVKVLAQPGALLTNCAAVSAFGDVNPANNRACLTTVVQR